MSEGAPKSPEALREEEILTFWREHKIFDKTLTKPSPNGTFVFYEGPPTANGKPGVHHLESRSFKDAIPRYKTMRGYNVPRRAGWDTHGLPVELEIEKELGFKGKKDIEVYGIAAFNKKCRESVLRYIGEWQKFSDRAGYWVDQSKAYFTYDAPFMESVWWILKKVSDDGRLYKDYKVVPWCTRCGTALSSHELAQGYAEVKDLAVTARFELVDAPKTYFLAWTTTPWTLPGNVGLAVGEKIAYGTYEKEGEKVIVAVMRKSAVLDDTWTLIEETLGSELVGKAYKPLYPFSKEVAGETEAPKFEKAYKVYPASFVTTEDGTGIVHTAVMYGQEDFELGTQIGLPKVHLVQPDGNFVAAAGFLAGRFVKDEEVAVDIIKDLAGRGILFSKEKYAHTYPFCWRCKTPLIYYARDSWYIRMQDLRERLVSENNSVNWEPSHIREGRMGEWLKGAKDWAVSRERYWGTPLPVWENEEERVVVGSIEELTKRTKRNNNSFFVMRHGEAEHNVKGVLNGFDTELYALTDAGRERAKSAAQTLQTFGVTHIYTSPFKRARETALIAAEMLGLSKESVVVDERLRELNFGELEGTSFNDFLTYRSEHIHAFDDAVPGGESYFAAKNRFAEFAYECEEKFKDAKILVVSHGIGVESFCALTKGLDKKQGRALLETLVPKYAVAHEFDFVPLPHNEDYELDIHRPYIDDVVLVSDTGKDLVRVKEVIDVWFDSGAVPFAQDHYPFENKGKIDGGGYPADYISEAIDQTRGWFYTLLAVGTLLGKGRAYKNVICLGHLLDEKSQKMSKTKGNVINPWEAMDEWGVDTLRFWMYSVNQPGDSKSFAEKTVKESARVLSWIDNSVKFYELFKRDSKESGTKHILDVWMTERTKETVRVVTKSLDAYDLYTATRTLSGLVEDLSQWYVRRVRDRVRDGDVAALHTLQETLRTIALLLAPFAPFLAESVFQSVKRKGEVESVHLADWPVAPLPLFGNKKATQLITDMKRVRTLSSTALMERQKVGVKVRQPLGSLSFGGAPLAPELRALIAEELNVKEVRMDSTLSDGEVKIDATLTPELIAEGDVREFARALADARKAMDLAPRDRVTLVVDTSAHSVLSGAALPGTDEIAFENLNDAPYSAELSTGRVGFSIHAS